MKRMKPDAYKLEAQKRIAKVTDDLVARTGVWNAKKIKDEMEQILRTERLLEDKNKCGTN